MDLIDQYAERCKLQETRSERAGLPGMRVLRKGPARTVAAPQRGHPRPLMPAGNASPTGDAWSHGVLMDSPSSSVRDLARTLLTESQIGAESHLQEVERVAQRLRNSLTPFAGAIGVASLLKRAVALAGAELPALRGITVSSDGRLRGLEQLATYTKAEREQAAIAIAAHVLGLLSTFIGEPLTKRLMLQASPETSPNEDQDE